MFQCERCGSGYNGSHIGVENCPRCLLLDRVQAPLSFKMFKIGEKGDRSVGEMTAPAEVPGSISQEPARSAP